MNILITAVSGIFSSVSSALPTPVTEVVKNLSINDTNPDGSWKLVVSIIVIVAFITALIILLKKPPPPLPPKDPSGSGKKIADKINKFFESYEKDEQNYYLYEFLSRQFDLEEYQKDYKRKNKEIGSLRKIIDPPEIKEGRNTLKKIVAGIAGKPLNTLTESDCLIFLRYYHSQNARLMALKIIKDQIQPEDKDRYIKYQQGAETEIDRLIQEIA